MKPMSCILELAKKRRTARKFKQRLIELEDIIPVLEAASQAPSGANYQPWRFLIVTDPEIKSKIRIASEEGEKEFYRNVKGDWAKWLDSKSINWIKPYLENAPLLIVVFSKRGAPYSTESVWLGIGYMLLSLEEIGLSTITYTPSDPVKVHEVLDVPEEHKLEGHTADRLFRR